MFNRRGRDTLGASRTTECAFPASPDVGRKRPRCAPSGRISSSKASCLALNVDQHVQKPRHVAARLREVRHDAEAYRIGVPAHQDRHGLRRLDAQDCVADEAPVTITAAFNATSSAASAGRRASWPYACRKSMTRLRPSPYPKSRSACLLESMSCPCPHPAPSAASPMRNASTRAATAGGAAANSKADARHVRTRAARARKIASPPKPPTFPRGNKNARLRITGSPRRRAAAPIPAPRRPVLSRS